MGLIREALRVPRLEGEEEAEAAVIRLIDGSAIGVSVPYDVIGRLVFGHRPLAGAPRGLRIDEKRGWLVLGPPACDGEDEGIFPLTAIVAILPLYLEGRPAEPVDAGDAVAADRFSDEYYVDETAPGSNGSDNVGHPGDDRLG